MSFSREQFIQGRAEKKREQQETLTAAGGIAYEEVSGGERFINAFGVRVKTYIDKPQFDEVKKGLDMSALDATMMQRIAEAHTLQHALMFEGAPGAGKTFAFEKFYQFIHGKDVRPVILTCTPKTSELEIIGHWAPAPGGRSSADPKIQNIYREYDESSTSYDKAREKYNSAYAMLREKREKDTMMQTAFDYAVSSINAEFASYQEQYKVLLARLQTETAGQVEWQFKEGALMQIYTGNGGRGRPGMIDELNLMPANVQQIFLQVVGERSRLRETLQFHTNSKDAYPKGEDTSLFFAQNLSEMTEGRNMVAAPLTDRVEWVAIPPEEVAGKEIHLIKGWGGAVKAHTELPESDLFLTQHNKDEKPLIVEACGGEVVRVMGELLARFHAMYKDIIRGTPDTVDRGDGEDERIQKLEHSFRRASRTMNYAEQFLVVGDNGRVDLEETIASAITREYIDCLFSKSLRGSLVGKLEALLSKQEFGVKMGNAVVSVHDALAFLSDRFLDEEMKREFGENVVENQSLVADALAQAERETKINENEAAIRESERLLEEIRVQISALEAEEAAKTKV